MTSLLTGQRTTCRHRAVTFTAAMCAGAIASLAAQADEDRFLLIDSELNGHTVRLVELSHVAGAGAGGDPAQATSSPSIRVLDEQRRVWMGSHEITALALIRDRDWSTGRSQDHSGERTGALGEPSAGQFGGPSGGLLTGTDGSRYTGSLTFDESFDETGTFGWTSRHFGLIRTSQHNVLTLESGRRQVEWSDSGIGDEIVLTNGDRIDGFVISVGRTFEVEVESDDPDESPRVISIPAERIEAVRFVNQPVPAPANAAGVLWLADGSRVYISEAYLTADHDRRLRVRTARAGADDALRSVPLGEVAAILFEVDAIVPLSSLRPRSVDGSVVRYLVSEPQTAEGRPATRQSRGKPPAGPPMGLADLEIHGPVRVTYDLPGDVTRFATEVELPRRAHRWGDVTLVIMDGTSVVYEGRFNASSPSDRINVSVTSDLLTVELRDEAGRGPVQNMLLFRRPMLR